MFKCKDYNRCFGEPHYITETHNLNCPPYEQIDVCPHCKSSEFIPFDPAVDKLVVAEKLLDIIVALNRYDESVKDVYGIRASNVDLDYALRTAAEFVSELYEFLPAVIDNKIIHANSENDTEKIISFLEG